MSVRHCKDILGKGIYSKLRKELDLSLKEALFVGEYTTNGFNATEAYSKSIARKNAKRSTCKVEASHVLNKPNIQKAIRIVIDVWLGEKKVKLEQKIIDQLNRQAFYDPFMFYNPDGTIKIQKEEDIPEEYRCCIEHMEVKYYGKDGDRKVIVLKLSDRTKARAELSKYIKIFGEQDGTIGLTISDETIKKLNDVFEGKGGKE